MDVLGTSESPTETEIKTKTAPELRQRQSQQKSIFDSAIAMMSDSNAESNAEGSATPADKAKNVFGKLSLSATNVIGSIGGNIGNTGRAIGNLIPTGASPFLQSKYTLPDKTVASQVLMYRQLLHCKCRSGLRLSRPYQATAAQKAVLHMPWWEQGIEDSGKMVISYDNLIVRLWMNGAIMPFADMLTGDVDTLIDEKGLPPIPHEFWVERLGFQQPDPVTDFRSGGVLSLAMMVHMVESCLTTVKRFHPDGDAAVLPFGITCINVTDMMAKFLMLAKSTDKMEALMSQKPFWRMFADPNAILACQEISMNMLCDVVGEMNRERCVPGKEDGLSNMPGGGKGEGGRAVTVFDFSEIMERTERRVRDDLLGAGPKSVEELRLIAGRLKIRYEQQLLTKENSSGGSQNPLEMSKDVAGKAVATAGSAVAGAGSMAAGVFEKMKITKIAAPTFTNPLARKKEASATPVAEAPAPTVVDLPPPTDLLDTPPAAVATAATTAGNKTPEEGSWHGVSKQELLPAVDLLSPVANTTTDMFSPAASAASQFSIDDDDDI